MNMDQVNKAAAIIEDHGGDLRQIADVLVRAETDVDSVREVFLHAIAAEAREVFGTVVTEGVIQTLAGRVTERIWPLVVAFEQA